MRRSFIWTFLCVLTLIVAPLASQFALPVGVARAEPDAPAAVHHDEVVTLSPNGQIIVTDVFPQPGMVPANWNSDVDVNWQYIAAGDFRDDGYEQIVAISGGRLKVFDPFAVAAGKTKVTFECPVAAGWNYELVATGDFNRDGKDDIAATASYGSTTTLWVYNVSSASCNPPMYTTSFGAPWHAITAGDFNNDGASDLAMVRQPTYIKVYSGLDWSTMVEGTVSNYPYITLAAGRLSSPNLPDQLALLRTGVEAKLDSLLMFNVSSYSGFSDVFPGQSGNFRYDPNFTSLALGNLTASPQQLIFMLRDSQAYGKTGLLMVNPAGLYVRPFEIGFADYWAWKQVRTGDMDGDGLSEVVILSAARLWVFTHPQVDDNYREILGSYRLPSPGADWPVMVLANLDGPGVLATPTLSVTPASLSFNLEFGATSPPTHLTITNTGAGSSFPWQAQVTEGSDWLQIDTAQGTTPGQVNVSVKTNIAPKTQNPATKSASRMRAGHLRSSASAASATNRGRHCTW